MPLQTESGTVKLTLENQERYEDQFQLESWTPFMVARAAPRHALAGWIVAAKGGALRAEIWRGGYNLFRKG